MLSNLNLNFHTYVKVSPDEKEITDFVPFTNAYFLNTEYSTSPILHTMYLDMYFSQNVRYLK